MDIFFLHVFKSLVLDLLQLFLLKIRPVEQDLRQENN